MTAAATLVEALGETVAADRVATVALDDAPDLVSMTVLWAPTATVRKFLCVFGSPNEQRVHCTYYETADSA